MPPKYFIVDAETDGLDGAFLSIAAAVYDENWSAVERYYSALKNAESNHPWVQQNVLPHLKNAHRLLCSEEALLQDFFVFWIKYRKDVRIFADVPCPVEARLFARCLQAAKLPPEEYPFPIFDLSSILCKAGIDPLTSRKELVGHSYTAHDAMEDVIVTAEILHKIFPAEAEAKLPHSYHTFVFPFLFDDGGKVSREDFRKCMSPLWHPDFFDERDHFINRYNQFHYFNVAAQNAMYNRNGADVVENYYYHFDAKAEYVIRKSTDNANYEYRLNVNAVRLRLYNTNIGMLEFELENFRYSDYDDICRINEYGRRVYAPFLAPAGNGYSCPICADEIILTEAGREPMAGTPARAYYADQADETLLISPLTALLSSGEYSVTNRKEHDKKQFYIEPVIDDRMFTACFYTAGGRVAEMTQWRDGNYRFMRDALTLAPDCKYNTAGQLYRLVFVDPGDPSCQSRTMLHDLLGKHIYHRWAESQTLTGITEYSMVTAADTPPEHVVQAFLIEYIEMLVLVLAQRASLLVFERRLSDASLEKQDIQKIQRDYTQFQSQLLLQEVTPQQQGIELYDMLRENLFINKEQKDIEAQISNLFIQRENETDRRQNTALNILAILTVFECASVIFDWVTDKHFLVLYGVLGIVFILAIILLMPLLGKHHIFQAFKEFFHRFSKK